MSEFKLRIPVAFMIFNRPDTTEIVFREIQKAKPPKLYIVSDAARESKPGEKEIVEKTRAYVESHVDWECEVYKNYAEDNMGCKRRMASGITWVMEQEEMAIILEDDCVPAPEFFQFQQEMLEKYKDDEKVMIVSGTNNFPRFAWEQNSETRGKDYLFSKFACIWGWGTFQRAWKKYDIDMKDWPETKKAGMLKKDFSALEYKVFCRDADRQYAGLVDTWDMQWLYRVVKCGTGIVPRVNLIHNIGCGHAEATHTKDASREVREYGGLAFPLRESPAITESRSYNRTYCKGFYGLHRIWNAMVHKIF